MAEENGKLENVEREFRAMLARATGGLAPNDYGTAFWDWWLNLAKSPGTQLELQQNALAKAMELWKFNLDAMQGKPLAPAETGDRRFADPAWQQYPFNVWAQAFRSSMELLEKSAHGVPGVEPQNAERVEFAARHAAEALSPTNNPLTNPEVLKQTVEERGQNLARGYKNFLEDLERMQNGGETPAAEEFRVGEKVAVTEGQVVLRNELMELIQYSPTTPDVHPEPLLVVPAWIMKYYILDLTAADSLVRYLVAQGHTVFMVSWRNPGPRERDLGMDDYRIHGVHAAIDEVCRRTGSDTINAAGYCLGGTLLSMTAAAMARDGDERLGSLTLLAAQVDFTEPGELSLFIDESEVSFLEATMWHQGFLDTRQMAGAFQLIRSNDLIWSRRLNHYLLNKPDEETALTSWNLDATRMPYRMHAQYLRQLFLNNDLATGRYLVDGRAVALSDIDAPVFAVGTVTDHVAPWRSVYKLTLLLDAELTFLLTSGGHNAGIISPPGKAGRSYQVATRKVDSPFIDPGRWQEENPHQAGSWWPEWEQWLARRAGPMVAAVALDEALADAPGEYVRQA